MKFLLPFLVSLISASAFAAPAMEYSCNGKDVYYQSPVVFKIVFADWAREAGYTYHAIEIQSLDGKPSNEIIDLSQKVLPNCSKKQSYNSLSLKSTQGHTWEAEFSRGCDAEVDYVIGATCVKNY